MASVKGGEKRPVVLTIAGSDNSAGAGIQADLKTFSFFGCYGLTAVTCVVAEVPGQVSALQAVKPEIVAEQVKLSVKAFPVAAVKTGMLYSTAIIEEVVKNLPGKTALVVDPVMAASSGDSLLKKSAIAAYRKHLIPKATLVTPNLDELGLLAGRKICNAKAMREAGEQLFDSYGVSFLLKGGHLEGREAIDYLVTKDGVEEFAAPFIQGADTHGTGCTYSAAIAAHLALGFDLSESVARAKGYITAAIAQALRWGRTRGLEHFPRA